MVINEWVPTSEKSPNKRGEYLVACYEPQEDEDTLALGWFVTIMWWNEIEWIDTNANADDDYDGEGYAPLVLYWMPLPEPPQT